MSINDILVKSETLKKVKLTQTLAKALQILVRSNRGYPSGMIPFLNTLLKTGKEPKLEMELWEIKFRDEMESRRAELIRDAKFFSSNEHDKQEVENFIKDTISEIMMESVNLVKDARALKDKKEILSRAFNASQDKNIFEELDREVKAAEAAVRPLERLRDDQLKKLDKELEEFRQQVAVQIERLNQKYNIGIPVKAEKMDEDYQMPERLQSVSFTVQEQEIKHLVELHNALRGAANKPDLIDKVKYASEAVENAKKNTRELPRSWPTLKSFANTFISALNEIRSAIGLEKIEKYKSESFNLITEKSPPILKAYKKHQENVAKKSDSPPADPSKPKPDSPRR